jgi:hypothetical protein
MFLAANLITRRELASKLDRPLGAVEPLDPDWTQLPHLDATTSQLEI